jgi:hypothetical protein
MKEPFLSRETGGTFCPKPRSFLHPAITLQKMKPWTGQEHVSRITFPVCSRFNIGVSIPQQGHVVYVVNPMTTSYRE